MVTCILFYLFEVDRGDDHGLYGPIPCGCRGSLYRLNYIEAGNYFAKHCVLSVEEGVVCHIDKKLAAVGVGPRVGHGDGAHRIAIVGRNFVGKLVARAAGTPACLQGVVLAKRVAALDHKARDDAVELGAIVKARSRELGKVSDRVWGGAAKLDYDVALSGAECVLHDVCLISNSWR